jgi:hypothetical protein
VAGVSGWREFARRLKYAGLARYCPLCRSHVRVFLAHGVVSRPNAVCPVCLSRDRHRLAWLWLRENTQLGKAPDRLLHIAPETSVAQRLQTLPHVHYVSADLVHRASVRMDICRMPFREQSFDTIYCSHVLNMLPDDRPAMTELFRVLRPGGLAVLQVPTPLEGPGIEAGLHATSGDRLKLFGDPHICRRYGSFELNASLSQAGFDVQVVHWSNQYSEAEKLRLGLIDEPLHVCRRPELS